MVQGKKHKNERKVHSRNPSLKKTSAPLDAPAPVADMVLTGLTKQQKRDLKRNAANIGKMSPRPVVATTSSAPSCSVSVKKRENQYPKEFISQKKFDSFAEPSDSCYEDIIKTSYSNLAIDKSVAYPAAFHDLFKQSLLALDEADFYQFDYTQPTGLTTKVAKTFVTRCLLGDPGTTYKYLGLRMFSIPWDAPEAKGCDKKTAAAMAAAADISKLNKQLTARTDQHLSNLGRPSTGSSSFNITLINKCFPSDTKSIKLKNECLFQQDKCSVSWHADSSLQHYSSIAVYHLSLPPSSAATAAEREGGWRVALNVTLDAEGPHTSKAHLNKLALPTHATPAVAVPLESCDTYYMLDDFNHHHQHAVLAGSTLRYSSTHRVCRVEGHTFASIKARCINALQGHGCSLKQCRAEQMALNELEFEWIRQYFIQGERHHDIHQWWREPMNELVDLWVKLEDRCKSSCDVLFEATGDFTDSPETGSNSDKSQRKKCNKRKAKVPTVEIGCYAECSSLMLEVSNQVVVLKAGGDAGGDKKKLYLSTILTDTRRRKTCKTYKNVRKIKRQILHKDKF